MSDGFAKLTLREGRTDGVRVVKVPKDMAQLLESWVEWHHDIDPVQFLRDQLRKKRLPPPRGS